MHFQNLNASFAMYMHSITPKLIGLYILSFHFSDHYLEICSEPSLGFQLVSVFLFLLFYRVASANAITSINLQKQWNHKPAAEADYSSYTLLLPYIYRSQTVMIH